MFEDIRFEDKLTTQKEITSQTDFYLVLLSSKTYIFEDIRFEDKLTTQKEITSQIDYNLVCLQKHMFLKTNSLSMSQFD